MPSSKFALTNSENLKIQQDLAIEAEKLTPSQENKNLRSRFNNWKKSNDGKTAIDFLLRKQLYICPGCFASISNREFHVHHLMPISKLTEESAWKAIAISNLVVLCSSCNLKQSNKVDLRFE